MQRTRRAVTVVALTTVVIASLWRDVSAQERSAAYLTLNVAVSDAGVEPTSVFVPAGRPVQLMLRNRGTTEHHYRVVGLAPDGLQWIVRGDAAGATTTASDEHSAHHDRRARHSREASQAGITPSGREVHAYVSVPGEIDVVLFTAHEPGRYVVRCDLHDEALGTLTVFDETGDETSAAPAPVRPGRSHLLARALTKDLGAVAYPSAETVDVEATYATAEYVALALGGTATTAMPQPDRHIAFLVTERSHRANLPQTPPVPTLHVDGRPVPPVDSRVMTDSVHHRATFYRFTRDASFGQGHQMMTLRLGAANEATWHLPLVLPPVAGTAATGLGEQWALVLALLGGMVAAMWPCLFQLTVYFIPALAGVAMQDGGAASKAAQRRQVLSAAFYFILGFTLVYTATGALIGFAAQRFGQTAEFATWQRYFGMVAGVVVIGLALRVAAKVRAPLVCKMPVLSRMAHAGTPATKVEMMLAGLAFATGCMTCFGSALVVGMVVYVGLAQSALYGALVLFLFSLGMGIPLVIAALAMARALPLLMKLESAVPWMGLASAVLMAGFGVLLLSGNYMLVSEWTVRVVTGAGSVQGGAMGAALTALVLTALGLAWLASKGRVASARLE